MTDVLIVDDSALMRRFLGQIFEDEGGFNVRIARNGEHALRMMADQMPDVVTLDINMPEMDGLTCLSHIMTRHPCPVIMVSSLTERGAMATLEALELGAVDYVTKPGGTVSQNMEDVAAELATKVKGALGARPRAQPAPAQPTPDLGSTEPEAGEVADGPPADGLVLIGVSTGGPGALETVLPALPENLAWPVVITQHMPATFTSVLAKRLNGHCALQVVEVSKPTPLTRGYVYIARGDGDIEIRRRAGKLMAIPVPPDDEQPWHPSTNRMVDSALRVLGPQALMGVLLTGMGDDGADAMTRLFKKGGHTIAESDETSVVFGMPRALIEQGGAELTLPVDSVGQQIVRWLS